MTPHEFITKWKDSPLGERAGAQAFFLDLCDLLGVDKPTDPDSYCFERGATRTGASHGWADVWKRGCFAWENKAPGKDLGIALKQLMTYALALDNPPLLVVSDRQVIQIHTHFTGTPSETHTIALDDIGRPENLQKLRWLFEAPENFRPQRSTYNVTEDVAARMGNIAKRLTDQSSDPLEVAHFLIQCVFCMFAEDARLLPAKLFETVLDKSNPDGDKARARLTELFQTMQKGGDFALQDIPWFDGGLFARIAVPELTTPDVVDLLDAARMNWRAVEPAIMGTLFERGLNPDMRSQLGAHYTDPATILKLIRPVIEAPLMREWEAAKAAIAAAKTTKAKNAIFVRHLERLKDYRVLDPACGSGNFLYLSLKSLKDLEHRANLEAETLGLHRQVGIEVSPGNVMGIELNPYAAELARVTVWIGEIQWMLDHGYDIRRDPILRELDYIECRDAVLAPDGKEPDWPKSHAIVSNPPFLGTKKQWSKLGRSYTSRLRDLYQGRVPGFADLVCYWFEKARASIETGKCQAAGLVATNSIRGGVNRRVLDRICQSTRIFEAWSDEPWFNDGAAVRVSLVCFGASDATQRLDGSEVARINPDLTAGSTLSEARKLLENVGCAFVATVKAGPFDIPGATAREWLKLPNPNGRPNSDVLRPWANGMDITRRPSDTWIIDFGVDRLEQDAMPYQEPYAHVAKNARPLREKNNRVAYRIRWWRLAEPIPKMRVALGGLTRYIATPALAKHRLFVWVPASSQTISLSSSLVPMTQHSAFFTLEFTKSGRCVLGRASKIGLAIRQLPPSKLSPSPRD